MSSSATGRAVAEQIAIEEQVILPDRRSRLFWQDLAYGAVLATVDCLSVLLAFLLAFLFRASFLPKLGFQLVAAVPVEPYLENPWLLLLFPFVFAFEGLYRRGIGAWDEVVRVLKCSSFAAVLLMAASFGTHQGHEFSRVILVATWLFALVTVPALRVYCRTRFLVPAMPLRFLVLAGNEPLPDAVERIATLRACGYQHLQTVVLDKQQPEEALRSAVRSLRKEFCPDELFLDPQGLSEPDFRKLLRCLESSGNLIRIMSNLPVILKLRASVHNVDGLLLFDLDHGLGRPFNRFIKRSMDLVGAVVLLVLLAPLFLLIAVCIKLDSRGSVLYSHRRLDFRGRILPCLKFRTMYQDAERRLRGWIEAGDARAEEFRIAFKLKDDPRVTRVGKLLRKTSLDELPQLFNVLRGEMSLVGPRPIVPEEVSKYGDDQQFLRMAKGGMTGLWQVSGRNDIEYAQRILLDGYYIRNWSIWSDLVILLKTVVVLFDRRGAY